MKLELIIEALLMAAKSPLTIKEIEALFKDGEKMTPTEKEIIEALNRLKSALEDRGVELVEVATGWRIQVSQKYSYWVAKLFKEREERYSRAFFETLALIAYEQPITRGDIEVIRGVSVSSNIMKTLEEREWIEVIGRREVPGRPMIYATTKQFLDDFNLKSLEDLPDLDELELIAKRPVQLGVEFAE